MLVVTALITVLLSQVLGALLPQTHVEALLFSSPIPECQPLRTNACSFLEPPLA